MQRPFTRDALIALAVFVVGFALFWAFRALGWFAQDEGVIYYHYLRTHQGQLPYRDFFTGYGPVTLYLHAALFSLFGVSLDATRVFMAVVNASSGVLLYLVTRRLTSWPFAIVPPLLFFTMQPGDIADMAFHNTPYPLWYLVTLFAAAALALMRAVDTESARSRAAWMFLIGVLGGVALFTKQNGGIFLLWAATGFLASYPLVAGGAAEHPLWRFLRALYLSLIPLSMLLLSWTFTSIETVAAYVAPLAALAWLGSTQRFSAAAIRVALVSAFWIALGVAAATAPWFVFFADSLGVGGFIDALFFWGKYVDRQIYLAYPLPGGLAVFAIAAALVPWYCAAVLGRTGWRAAPAWARVSAAVAIAALIGGTLAVIGVYWLELRRFFLMQYNPWRVYRQASIALDSALAYLALVVLAGGVALALRQSRGELRAGDPPRGAFLAVLWTGACSYLLYYPRMDAAHFISAAVLLYSVGAVLVDTGSRRLAGLGGEARPLLRHASLAAVALFIVFAANLKMAPKVYSIVMLPKEGEDSLLVATPTVDFAFSRANVYFPIYEKTHRQIHRAFIDTIEYVRANTEPGDPIFSFPANPMIYFASERDNPTRHDYFLSNNVPFDEQVRLLQVIEDSAIELMVIPSDENDYFVDTGRPYHNLLWAYIRQEFYLDKRFGPYDVWRRYDGTPAAGKKISHR